MGYAYGDTVSVVTRRADLLFTFSLFNASEPLGLPRGSIRGIVTLMIASVFSYRFAIGADVDPSLTFALGSVLTYYFVKRDGEGSGPVEERLPAPALGDED